MANNQTGRKEVENECGSQQAGLGQVGFAHGNVVR